MRNLVILAVLLRIGFILYGFIQDQHPVIKFTGKFLRKKRDVDMLLYKLQHLLLSVLPPHPSVFNL